MSQICAITSCKRSSCALCHCCQQNICLPHLKEHQDALISQLNPFIDQINALGDRLNAFNTEFMIGNCRQELEQWRVECHQKIDHFFKQKCQELDQSVTEKLTKLREEIDRVQPKIAELIREQDVTHRDLDLWTSNIGNLEREMNKIEQTCFKVKMQSLEIDANWIRIEESSRHQLDLSTLPAVYKTIKHTKGSFAPMSSNARFLLMHQEPNLCLIDRELTVIKKVLWNHDFISDMCWSSVLDRFIVVDENNVFLVDQNTMPMLITPLVLTKKYLSCTCSDTSLFLSTYNVSSSIMEYSLLPSIQLIKTWKSPVTCEKKEIIYSIRYSNETIALLMYKPQFRSVYIELRTAKTLDRLWSLQLDIENVQKNVYSFCLVSNDEWLVADPEVHRLIHITSDGKIKASCAYNSEPLYPIMFGFDTLAIYSGKELNFHKL